jgi:hypothetical protein
MPRTIRVVADNSNPLTFSTKSSTPGSSPPPRALLRADTRIATGVDFTREFGNVVLGRNKYYTPTSSTHPLFDPFIVDPINPQTAVISVLQITTSPRHGGSARGYLYIRKLTIHVRKLLEQLSKLGLPKKKGSKQKAPPPCYSQSRILSGLPRQG